MEPKFNIGDDTEPSAPPNESTGDSLRWATGRIPIAALLVALGCILLGVVGGVSTGRGTATHDTFNLLFWIGEIMLALLAIAVVVLFIRRRRQVK